MDSIAEAGKQLAEYLRKAEPSEVQALLAKAGIAEPTFPAWGVIDGVQVGPPPPVTAFKIHNAARLAGGEWVDLDHSFTWTAVSASLDWPSLKALAATAAPGKTEEMPLAC